MKIQLETGNHQRHYIRTYEPGRVVLHEDVYTTSLIVTPEQIISDWPPQVFSDLDQSHFDIIAELGPEIVILGTGRHLRFPASAVTRPLITANIGLEVMDTGAACRTFNILLSEERRVVVALLMIEQQE